MSLLCFVGLVCFLTAPLSAWCEEPKPYKINDIIEKANDLDGQKVIIQGEVIGDVMARKDHVWFNVQDDSGAMGVWAQGALAEHILVTGDYNYQGDWVEIAGTFSRADKELAGEICVRAEMVDVLKRGHRLDHALNPIKVKVALVLSLLCALLLMLRMATHRR